MVIRVLCKLRSLGLQGVTGYEVTAECDLSGGLPNFDIVGLPDAAVKEARERVRSAVKNCGFSFPVSRITVNLAPANRRKAGTVYDLPILVGLLAVGVLALLGRPLKHLLRLCLRTGVGLAALAAFSPVGGLIGVSLGVNLANALVMGLLGVPGFGLLLMLHWALAL